MTATSFRQDGALKHLLQLLWQAGWDNTIFSLELRDDGSLSPWLSGFQVTRAGLVLGAEQVPDGGFGTVVVKVEAQERPGACVIEERFTTLEIWHNQEFMQHIATLIEKLHLSG